MKSVVLYSSLTGNTKKVASSIASAIENAQIKEIDESLSLDDYDFVAVGFWLDSGHVDKKSLEVIKKLKNKKVALFGTLGGDPNSEGACKVMDKTVSYLDKSNKLVGTLWIQGKVSEDVLKKIYESFPHLKNDESHMKRILDASGHPSAQDLDLAFYTAKKWAEA